MRVTIREKLGWTFRALVGSVLVAGCLIPVVWLVSVAFKPEGEWLTHPVIWLPTYPTFDNFLAAFFRFEGLSALFSSILYVLTAPFLALFLGSLAAYGFSRYGRTSTVFLVYFIPRFLPVVCIVIPVLFFYEQIGLVDTYQGIVLWEAYLNIPFTLWIMKSFFDGVPIELEEAAMIDGCSRFGAFFRVALPLAAPGFVVAATFAIVWTWNEYTAMYFFGKTIAINLPMRLAMFNTDIYGPIWGPQAALSVVGVAPIIVVAFVLQKWIVKGLTFGAVKG